jgi:vanillate O-demethylase monooxygenase subunit
MAGREDATMRTPPVHNEDLRLRRAWHVAATSEEVDGVPRRVWLVGEPWCVVRIDGRVAAFADRCAHRGTPLSAGHVEGSKVRCAAHGWAFDREGTCVAVPALSPGEALPQARVDTPAAVDERYGLVWVAPEPPVEEIPSIPELTDSDYDVARSAIVGTGVGACQLVDNFLDAAHFPYVHSATFGTDAAATVVDHGVTRRGWAIENVFETWYRNRDDPLVASGVHDLVQPQILTKRGGASTTVVLRLYFPVTAATMMILFCCTPERGDSTRVYKVMARNDLDGDRERLNAFVADEDTILEEDLRVLERFRDTSLATDLRVEQHTRADRLSVAWRRVLSDLADTDTTRTDHEYRSSDA